MLQFIESYFGEDGNAYTEEIKQMDQLRAVSTPQHCLPCVNSRRVGMARLYTIAC